MTRRALVLLMLILAALPTQAHAAPNASYSDPDLPLSVTWNPDQFAMATVATGGILLSREAMVLMIGPDTHTTAQGCVDHRVQIDMIDTPLLYVRMGQIDPTPEPAGLAAEQAAAYAWPDGIAHFGWFGCIPIGEHQNIILRLLASTTNWERAVNTFAPVLDEMDYAPLPAATPSATI